MCIRPAQAVGGTTFQLVTTGPDFKVSAKATGQVVFEFQSLSWFVYKGFEKASTFKSLQGTFEEFCVDAIQLLKHWLVDLISGWSVCLFCVISDSSVCLSVFVLFLYLGELGNWMRLFLFLVGSTAVWLQQFRHWLAGSCVSAYFFCPRITVFHHHQRSLLIHCVVYCNHSISHFASLMPVGKPKRLKNI